MTDKGIPEFLWVVIHIFGKVEHDDQPNVIGSDFDITLAVVGIEEGWEEAIVVISHDRWFAGLFIGESANTSIIVPQRCSI